MREAFLCLWFINFLLLWLFKWYKWIIRIWRICSTINIACFNSLIVWNFSFLGNDFCPSSFFSFCSITVCRLFMILKILGILLSFYILFRTLLTSFFCGSILFGKISSIDIFTNFLLFSRWSISLWNGNLKE